jgi:hypothetical protein
VQGALPNNVTPFALQFCGAHCFCKDIMVCLQAILLASSWTIWKERNNRVFDHKELSFDKLICNIKLLVWWWLRARKHDFCFDLNLWLLNISACLGLFDLTLF